MSLDLSGFVKAFAESQKQIACREKEDARRRRKWVAVCEAAARKARIRLRNQSVALEGKKKTRRVQRKQPESEEISESEQPESEQKRFAQLLLKKTKQRARIAAYVFDLDVAWIMERLDMHAQCCEICGGKLEFQSRTGTTENVRVFREFPWNISLDQIKHGEGYTRFNVQLTHVTCNLMKLDLTMDELVTLCDSIVAHSKRKSLTPLLL